MDRKDLETALVKAHEDNDYSNLIALYTTAADQAEAAGDIDASCFYLTHAFVFALEAGAPEAPVLNIKLADRGRAKLLEF